MFHILALYPADPGHALNSLTRSSIFPMRLPHVRSAMVRVATLSHAVTLGTLLAANVRAAGQTPRYLHVATTAPAPLRLILIAILHSFSPHAGTSAVFVLHLHCVRWMAHRPDGRRSPSKGVARALGV